MKYERLTNAGKDYTESEAIDRLWELEDKIENGILVELPCKVGDTVWVIAKQGMDIYTVEETTVWDFWFSTTENRFYPIDANEIPLEKVFLTKSDAEKRLEELQKEDDYEDFCAMALGYDEFRLPQKN